jgi:hypothetical protein
MLRIHLTTRSRVKMYGWWVRSSTRAKQWPNRLDRVNHRSIKSINSFASQTSSLFVAPMDTQQPHWRIPTIQFRVLIIGRANAGKTSVLQRVCDTTEMSRPCIFYRFIWIYSDLFDRGFVSKSLSLDMIRSCHVMCHVTYNHSFSGT